MHELIIAEKPSAAKKIAEALADTKPEKKIYKGVAYYELVHKNKDIVIATAVGHLFGLAEKKKQGMKYPSYDIEWKPIYEVEKKAIFSKKYLDTLVKLAKKADSFVIACDYDIEGTTIGLNVLRFACKQKDGKRMKFSTLTKDELQQAYEEASPTLDWGNAKAGETRHELDWYYGINLSRAMTTAVKKAGFFKLLSIGRVQGPALNILVEKEKEIAAFKSKPFWQLFLHGKIHNKKIDAIHQTEKFWKEKEAEQIFTACKGKDAVVKELKKTETKLQPPPPFDLTTLQTEAYKCFGMNPRRTLDIAQDLYSAGYISYPRTSSQQLSDKLGFRNILKLLIKQIEYTSLCTTLLEKKKLIPNNGKKTDPAHPAIFPTGTTPKKLSEPQQKLYDLVVRRFLATFGEYAKRETLTAHLILAEEIFIAKGTRTTEKGWHVFYEPYIKLKEEELPALKEKDEVKVDELLKEKGETQPPNRYSQASLVREMEKKNLGTKATRASTVETLFKRNYVEGKSLKVTDLGMQTIKTMSAHVPEIIDEELTRTFEEKMEAIQENKKEGKTVLEEAKKLLNKITDDFKKNEKKIGDELLTATKESEDKQNTIGPCVKCGKGTLMIKRGRFGRFGGCSSYPDCEETIKLPATGLLRGTDKQCESCNYPLIEAIRKAKRPQEVCANPDCPTKKIEADNIGATCPKCGEGTLVVRKSLYGQFLGCNGFPKCRYIK